MVPSSLRSAGFHENALYVTNSAPASLTCSGTVSCSKWNLAALLPFYHLLLPTSFRFQASVTVSSHRQVSVQNTSPQEVLLSSRSR